MTTLSRLDEIEQQIKRLADFIMTEIPGEPSQSEGAVDTAIRLLKRLQAAETHIRNIHGCRCENATWQAEK